MATEHTIVVGVEDFATAGIVGVEAAHVAAEIGVTRIVLLHVLDAHPMLNTVYGMGNYCAPVVESVDETRLLFDLAENALRSELEALGHPLPQIQRHAVAGSNIAVTIEQVATEAGAEVIVLGARRPHALGRLIHPDVRAHVSTHTACRVHVAPLQAATAS